MINWFQNSQADYVLAAYGVAAFVLIGALVASWIASRCVAKRWQKIRAERFKGEA